MSDNQGVDELAILKKMLSTYVRQGVTGAALGAASTAPDAER